MTKSATARQLAWAIAALSTTLAVLAAGLMIFVQGAGDVWLAPHMLFGPGTTFIYALAGALVASRHPRNPIGWIFCAEGVLLGLVSIAYGYRMAGESGEVTLPGVEIARWLDMWIWIPGTLLPVSFVLLLFPEGRLPSRRWRPVAWSAWFGLAAYTLGTALHPRPQIEAIPPTNPFGIPGAQGILDTLTLTATPFLAIGVLGSLAALAVRFKRSRGIEREQLKWLAYAGIIGIVSNVALGIVYALWPSDPVIRELSIINTWITMALIGMAAGIAILRYRLYNIDLLINRTLVYGALSAGVVLIYVLLVGSLGALFQSSGNFVLAIIATGLAAILVQPLRARLQRSVNRLMYGERDDPYSVLSHLGQQLKTTLAPTAVLPSIAEAVAQTLKLPYVALALKQGSGLEIAAAYGMPSGSAMRLPLVYQTETVGQLLVEPRAPGESFTPAERRLLEDIALQAGVAAHAVRLTDDLQRARERLVTAREEERRRLRRDLHDGLGPQLASLTLMVAATRELLRQDADEADTLLQELAGQTQAAITDIRRVVYALRPPALDDLGLVPALREQAAHYSRAGLTIKIDAPDDLPPLSAAVEVAAYRIVQEALTNVVRHALARKCIVQMALTPGDALDVKISDDGVGLPAGGRAAVRATGGVGLTSMRERAAELGGTCLIESAPGRGTCIQARLPLRVEAVRESVEEDLWTASAS